MCLLTGLLERNGTMFLTALTSLGFITTGSDITALLAERLGRLRTTALQEFGPDGSYVMPAFAGFLLLILIIYIKSVIDTFRLPENSGDAGLFLVDSTGGSSAETDDVSADNVKENSFENVQEKDERPYLTTPKTPDIPDKDLSDEERRNAAMLEKEKELSRRLVISSATTDDILQLKEELNRQAQQRQIPADTEYSAPENSSQYEELKLHYEQQKEQLSELVCLIINMLSRDISSKKIAQAVYFRNGGQNSEEDILQLIRAVQHFISLCNTGKFDSLPDRAELPLNNDALYSWAEGDSSKCLLLLESLINRQIEIAEKQTGLLKETAYAQAASYACLFGTIAGTDNQELAKSSFELALELTPKDINAWSRYGDVYWRENNQEKALFAYQNVLENGEDALYAQQQANAEQKLSLYYTQSGNPEQAENMKKISDSYYISSGIKTALSEPEKEVLEIISAGKHENLHISVQKLLKQQSARYM